MDPEPRDENEERLKMLDMLASTMDRTVRLDAIKSQILEVVKYFQPRLASGSAHVFETVGMGLKRCGISLPFKAPVYATIAGLLTVENEPYAKDLANKLADAVGKDLAAAIRDGHAGVARRSLRFLACLGCSSMVSPTSVAEYILVLLDAALYELKQAGRSEYGVHCRGEFLAEIALSALPWAGPLLAERAQDELKKIVDSSRLIAEAWVDSTWRCVAPATAKRCVETFSQLLEATFVLKNNGWKIAETIIPRPYEEFEVQLGGGHEIIMSPLTIPGHSKLTRYSAPRFRLYLVNPKPESNTVLLKRVDGEKVQVKGEGAAKAEKPHESDAAAKIEKDAAHSDDVRMSADGEGAETGLNDAAMKDITVDPDLVNGDVQGPKPEKPDSKVLDKKLLTFGVASDRTLMEKLVLRAYIVDIVDNFSTNHVLAAERLLTFPMLNNVDGEIVEGLFSQLCAMPEPTFAPVYYGTLFVDLCRVKDSRLPVKLLTAVEAMFQDAGLFDPESFDRLTEWFSFHLSNFEYKWNWSDWALYADADMVDKFPFRAQFCKDVLSRCIRLSYYERILDIVPEEMKYFLPPKPSNGNMSRFDDAVNDNLMTVVTGKDKQEAKVVMDRLCSLLPIRSVPPDAELQKKAESDANRLRLSSLIRAILLAGCKTLSHFDTVAERYLSLLLQMTEAGGIAAKRLVTSEVSCFWGEVHIRRMYVLDKLSMHRVIDGLSIIDSVLSEERADGQEMVPLTDDELKQKLGESSSWEMVRLVMQRARAREDGARAELTAASQAAAAANEGETERAELRLENAKTGTERAKKEISELLLFAFRGLFHLCQKLLKKDTAAEENEMDKSEYNRNLPGFDNNPLWYWRCLGMVRELARKHPRHLSSIIEQLESDTGDAREQHQELWDSFEIIREVEGCALLPKVW